MKKSSIMGISFQKYREKGESCTVCGEEVHESENYLVSMEGACHTGCVYRTRRVDVNNVLKTRSSLKIKNKTEEVKKIK